MCIAKTALLTYIYRQRSDRLTDITHQTHTYTDKAHEDDTDLASLDQAMYYEELFYSF